MSSTFSLNLPPFPNNTSGGIGFVVTKDFDSRNIKVVQDVVQTSIDRNRNARFIVYSKDKKSSCWIFDYLNMYKVPKENIHVIDDTKNKEQEVIHKKTYIGSGMYELRCYKEMIEHGNLDTIYIFTNRPKSMEVTELVNTSHMYNYKVFTIDSEGEYKDYTNLENNMNRRTFIEQHSQEVRL